MYNFIFNKMEDTLYAGEWWIKNLLFNLQFFDYDKLFVDDYELDITI